jgi:hypothetical protein
LGTAFGLAPRQIVHVVDLIYVFGEPAGTRTQDHLIKSFVVVAFSLVKSTMAVANFRAGNPLKAPLKAGFGNREIACVSLT